MSGRIVTGLAELGRFTDQKLGMIAPVGNVAIQTILFHRGVFPHLGASFLCMTLIAQIIKGIGLDHLGPEPAVVIVTVRTF
jgi:hypothetical protein